MQELPPNRCANRLPELLAAPLRLLAPTALIAVALLAMPGRGAARRARIRGAGSICPSVPGGSGPEPAKALGPVAVDPDAQAEVSAPVEAGLTGAGDTRIGLLFPILLGLALAAALDVCVSPGSGTRVIRPATTASIGVAAVISWHVGEGRRESSLSPVRT